MDLRLNVLLVHSGHRRLKFVDRRHVDELEKLISEYSQKLGIPSPLTQTTSELPTNGKELKKQSPESNKTRLTPVGPPSHDSSQAMEQTETQLSVVPEQSDTSEMEGDDGEDLPVMDGMVSWGRDSINQGSGSFYGASSTLNFVMKMAQNESPKTTYSSPETRYPHASKRRHSELEDEESEQARKYILRNNDFFALPQRHVASFLLESYFFTCQPVWPFLVEEDIRRRFDATWTSNDPQDSMWLAILNLIFALACQLCEDTKEDIPIENPLQAGKEFYHRARGFVLTNLFDSGSIEMVQALLLMSLYQQGTMRPNQCWLTVGHATRMAQAIGLHLDRTELNIPPLERELGKRLWWGCFCLDRYFIDERF
jgi:Fungal specific transcription factor domain